MTLPRIFIGSSRESLRLARGIKANLEEVGEVRIWDEDLFAPGRFALEELLIFTRSFDFAVFVWSGDDTTLSRGLTVASPRDNVMLEAGLFYGSLGRDRVFLVAPRNETVKTPSDLLGVTIATYPEPSDGNYRAATRSACNGLATQIERLGASVTAAPLEAPGLAVVSYPEFAAAREAMTAACKKAGEVKILSNKGLVFFGLDESVMSLAEVAEYSRLRRLRILLIDPESSWINRGLAALRRYESIDNYKRELSAAHLIVDSSMARFRTQLDLSRSGVRHHVAAPCFRLLMTEEVAFVSSYAEDPSTQVRDLPVFAYAREPGSLYQAYKRHFNELWHNEAHAPRSPETSRSVEVSAGGIVLTTDDQASYVALLQRDDGSWVLPKGHRNDAGEDLEETAVREVCEELGLRADDLFVERQLDDYTYDETVERLGMSKVTYLYVMRYLPGGRPAMSADVDHRQAHWWSVTGTLPFMHYAYQRTLLAETLERMFEVRAAFE